MKVIIPENCVLWTNKGICFPKDLTYGTEIFTIDPQEKLVTFPIMEELDEPEQMKVNSIITKNNICTLIPNYKIKTNDGLLLIKEIKDEQPLNFADDKYISEFKEIQNDKSVEFLEKSPFSVTGASYLGNCGIKDSREAAYFQMPDEESMREFGNKIQETLIPELGGRVSATKGVVNKSWSKDVSYLLLYRSDKFFKFRKGIKLTEDKILNSLYLNGINIYFGFLRSLLTKGFTYHLNNFIRGTSDKKYVVLNIPWKNKTRKLLQNSCQLWNTYQLSTYESKIQRNVNEVKVEIKEGFSEQKILEVKEHLMDCYEIEIPVGNKIITDNVIIKPFELTKEEIETLQNFEETVDDDLEKVRKKIMMSISSDTSNLKNISQINQGKKEFRIHILGIIKNLGKVNSSNTKFGKTVSVNAILSDETGETKMKIWGDVANEMQEGNALELFSARTQNGILYNTKDGYEKIYKMKEN